MTARYIAAVGALPLLVLAAAACGGKKPVVQPPTVVEVLKPIEVKVPVPVIVLAPEELLSPITAPKPVFVAPSDPSASSALTVEGERLLRALLTEYAERLRAWIVFYQSQQPQPPP